jgi:beta-lactamase class A
MTGGSDPRTMSEWLSQVDDVFSGQVAVAAHLLPTEESVSWNEHRVQRTASTVKLAVLVEALRRVDDGEIDYSERITLTADPRVICGGSGILKDLGPGLMPTVQDLCTLMVVLSDNTATNMLIDLAGGVDAVNSTMQQLGLGSVRLHIRAEIDLIDGDIKRFAEGTAGDFARLMTAAAEGRLISRWVSAETLRIMRRQQYLDQFPRYFRWNPYAEEFGLESDRISVASKTGFFPGVRTDVGLVSLPNRQQIAYAVFTENGSDESHNSENEGSVVVGLIGRKIIEHWWPAAYGEPPTIQTAATRALDERLARSADGLARL